jgi:hypothetical protein
LALGHAERLEHALGPSTAAAIVALIRDEAEAVVAQRLADFERERECETLPLKRGAELLGVTPAAMRMRIRRGFPASKVDGRLYVRRSDIDALTAKVRRRR